MLMIETIKANLIQDREALAKLGESL